MSLKRGKKAVEIKKEKDVEIVSTQRTIDDQYKKPRVEEKCVEMPISSIQERLESIAKEVTTMGKEIQAIKGPIEKLLQLALQAQEGDSSEEK